MAEQHGYQRSGKKCREKFENLYKYYKKTKEGKSGRQDGKHYRFFRQLEALYGDNTSNNNPISVNNNIPLQPSNIITNYSNQEIMQAHKFCESQSISISSEFDTSSSEDSDNNDLDITTAITLRDQNEALMEKKKNKLVMIKDNVQSLKRGRKSWKAKIRDFIDTQMKKLIETQEAWLEKMLKTLEQKEQERMMREEEWRKQDEARIDQEHKFWAKERAWFEARDAALMEALKEFTGKEVVVRASSCANNVEEEKEEERFESGSDINRDNYRWQEAEISSLIHIKNSMESRFQQEEDADEGALWEEISEKLACLGYDRNWKSCKEKWEDVNKYLTRRSKECNKKRKENAKMGSYMPNLGSINSDQAHDHSDHHHHHHHNHHHQETSCHVGQVCNSTAGIMQDSCFRFLMTEGEQQNNLWENYCVVKFNKEENQQ